MISFYTNAIVFTGTQFLYDYDVLVENNTIACIQPAGTTVPGAQVIDCRQQYLVPAFIDLQVYGARQQLFSAYPTSMALKALAQHNAASGTCTCMVTIATQPPAVIYPCIEAIRQYWQEGGKGICGMHLEGPYINPEKRGAHVKEWIHAPGVEEITQLLNRSEGILRMITIAPEIMDPAIIKLLVQKDLVLSLGHSNASFLEATEAFEKGITTVTHLFNAMNAIHHRKPGLPTAVMLHASVSASIIPDGIHVSFEMVKMAKQLMGERLFFITDAVTDCDTGSYRHIFNTDHFDLPDGTLSGSALTMIDGVRNAVAHCNISLEEALRMASLYPARVAGLQHRLGKIETGYQAALSLVSNDLSNAVLVSEPF